MWHTTLYTVQAYITVIHYVVCMVWFSLVIDVIYKKKRRRGQVCFIRVATDDMMCPSLRLTTTASRPYR